MAEAEKTDRRPALPTLREVGQSFALAVAAMYVAGFLVITSHLGRYGIREYDAFRVQYLIAGTMFALVVAAFIYFVGRFMLRTDQDTDAYKKHFHSLGGSGAFWEFWAITYNTVETGFMAVFAALILGAVLFPAPGERFMYAIGAVFAAHLLLQSQIGSFTRTAYVLHGIFMAFAIAAYFYVGNKIQTGFASLMIIAGVIVGFHQQQAKRVANPRLSISYGLIFGLVVGAGVFGSYFYGHVRPSVGGGMPQEVKLVFEEKGLPSPLTSTLLVASNVSAPADLITQTDREFILGIPARAEKYEMIVRVDRSLVRAVLAKPLPIQTTVED